MFKGTIIGDLYALVMELYMSVYKRIKHAANKVKEKAEKMVSGMRFFTILSA